MCKSVKNTSLSDLLALSSEKKEEIVFGGVTQDFCETDVVLLLGGPLEMMRARALSAVGLYKAGKVKYIIPTGAPENETEFGKLSECKYMVQILLSEGVSPDCIIEENSALTTVENMIFGALQIQRNLGFKNVKKVTIVSSYSHMKRSILLAKTFLPKYVTVYGYHSTDDGEGPKNWLNSKIYNGGPDYEIRLLKGLIDNGQAPDILF